jgi:hypothetical protein
MFLHQLIANQTTFFYGLLVSIFAEEPLRLRIDGRRWLHVCLFDSE